MFLKPYHDEILGAITTDENDVMQKGKSRCQSHRGRNIFSQFGRFRTVTPVLIYRWLRNYAQSLK